VAENLSPVTTLPAGDELANYTKTPMFYDRVLN